VTNRWACNQTQTAPGGGNFYRRALELIFILTSTWRQEARCGLSKISLHETAGFRQESKMAKLGQLSSSLSWRPINPLALTEKNHGTAYDFYKETSNTHNGPATKELRGQISETFWGTGIRHDIRSDVYPSLALKKKGGDNYRQRARLFGKHKTSRPLTGTPSQDLRKGGFLPGTVGRRDIPVAEVKTRSIRLRRLVQTAFRLINLTQSTGLPGVSGTP